MSPARAEPSFPKLEGRVTDAANIIPAGSRAELDAKLRMFEAQTGRQFVVATIPDLQGYDIADYGYQLGRAWGIGQRGQNNGILLIVAPNERRIRIEVGYGLEGDLPDAVASSIVRNDIRPRFKAGDLPGGISAGVDAVLKQLQLPPDQRAAAAARAASEEHRSARSSGPGVGTGLVILLILVFFVLPLLARSGRRGSVSGVPIIFWPGSFGGGGGGWGSGGGESSSGSDSFSGGGGDFGGGGASGDW
ncbi:MAG: TPM domain-containing protein [Sphingomonadaceae bacterium]|nr:TPM domain-containing protein [Sphingomonadaceae bacterium]